MISRATHAITLFVESAFVKMGIRFKCHHCQAPLNIKTELANKRGVCPECRGKFRIPSEDQELSLSLNEAAQAPSKALSEDESVIASNATNQERHPFANSQVTTNSASFDSPESESITNEPLYFVRPPSGGEYGPAGKETIELWISQRRITGETLMCLVGTSQWKKAKEVFLRHFVLE